MYVIKHHNILYTIEKLHFLIIFFHFVSLIEIGGNIANQKANSSFFNINLLVFFVLHFLGGLKFRKVVCECGSSNFISLKNFVESCHQVAFVF